MTAILCKLAIYVKGVPAVLPKKVAHGQGGGGQGVVKWCIGRQAGNNSLSLSLDSSGIPYC